MNKKKWVVFALILGLLSIPALFYSVGHYARADIMLPDEYYFVFNGQQRKAGTEYEMKTGEVLLNVTAGQWEPETTVEWVSSDPSVVQLEETNHGDSFVKLVRKGPGFATVTAVIKEGNSTYSLSCLIKIDLSVDYQKTGMVTSTTTKERILVLDELEEEKQIFLKYVDYIPEEGVEGVTGSAISASSVIWESDDESVVTVDEKGKVKAVGAGSTDIRIMTSTVSSQDRALQVILRVVVRPEFQLEFYDRNGQQQSYHSVDSKQLVEPVLDVPSDFVIESNASLATNLKWEIYDSSNGQKISSNNSNKMTYTISDLSGNVSFQNVKAGTYEIYAFANETYNTGTNAPYAYMKIIVPIDISDKDLVMMVGNTYNIKENSNIPSVDIFEYYYEKGNQNIAYIDKTTGIIRARSQGEVTLRLVYKTAQNLYDGASIEVEDILVTIRVIDGISLNITDATIFTSGTLLLDAIVTNPMTPITWFSSDPKIATVENGLVKGIKPGIVTITAKQIIHGIVKEATCEIMVQQSVSTIKLDPSEITIPIGEYKTIHAKITPSNLKGVKLNWKTSNDKVVSIVESSDLTTTIKSEAGGQAVISAINQDNVVVGYTHVNVIQPVSKLVLSETNVTVDLQTKRLQLRGTVYPENAQNKKIKWESSDTTRARVDANGLVTLLKPGTVSIIATSEDNPEVKAICNININIPVVSVALDETEKTMYVGQNARLSYLILPTNATNDTVTWTSTNPSVVAVDQTGKVTARGVGTAVIILKSVDGGHTVYCTIQVRRSATAIKLDAENIELEAGEVYHFEPTITPADSTDKDIVWESSDTKVAVVNEKGKVEAKAEGKAIIMARTETGGVAYCTVTVTQPVKGLILNFSEKTIYAGDNFELTVSVSPSDASERGVTWKSSNTDVATVSKDGVVKGLKGGVAVITCTTVDGGYSATSVVTVREKVTSITLNHESYILGIDKTLQLEAEVVSSSATNQKVTWKSSNKKVATVNKNGKVTGISIGEATITAIAQDGTEVEASSEIEVVRPVKSITLNNSYLYLLVGENKSLKATVKPNNATYSDVIWTSSDQSVVMVDSEGKITALKAGEATITASARDGSGKKSICYVQVGNRVPSMGITVMDRKLTMVPGEEKAVQVALNPVTSTDGFTWSTDNSAVASVDKKSGKITAKSTGVANITVMTDSGKMAVIEVTVIGLNFTSLTMEQYTRYPYALQVDGYNGQINWTVDNPEIAVVNNGMITSRAVGKATITATVNGRKLHCKITVTKIR